MTNPTARLLFTPVQVAAQVGAAVGTLAKMRLRGDGPRFLKIGASVRYDAADVQSWLDALPRRRSTSDTGAAS